MRFAKVIMTSSRACAELESAIEILSGKFKNIEIKEAATAKANKPNFLKRLFGGGP